LALLEARFGLVPQEMAELLHLVADGEKLRKLNVQAALCPDLEAFRASLSS
jgi:hypothetical protein